MKYQWLEKETASDLEAKIGCIVKSIARGYFGEAPNEKYGIEVELENETPDILAELDLRFQGLRREGGRDIETVVSGSVVLEHPNPYKQEYKLSALYGMTQAQLEAYIENNMTDLASSKDIVKKVAAVVLWLVKQTRLDE